MRMRTWALAVVALLGATRESEAQSLSVSGSPSTLRVQSAVAGSTPAPVSNSTTTYTINTGNSRNQKIIGRINTNMPAGVTLTVTLHAPGGSNGAGPVTLTTINQDLVTSIDKHTHETQSITYELAASLSAGVVTTQSRTVTLTVITGT